MRVAVALGVLGLCLGIHGIQWSVGGIAVGSCLGRSIGWFLDLNREERNVGWP
jgi:hypothetical protein